MILHRTTHLSCCVVQHTFHAVVQHTCDTASYNTPVILCCVTHPCCAGQIALFGLSCGALVWAGLSTVSCCLIAVAVWCMSCCQIAMSV